MTLMLTAKVRVTATITVPAAGDPLTVSVKSSDEAEATVPILADYSMLSAQVKKRQIGRGWIW